MKYYYMINEYLNKKRLKFRQKFKKQGIKIIK